MIRDTRDSDNCLATRDSGDPAEEVAAPRLPETPDKTRRSGPSPSAR